MKIIEWLHNQLRTMKSAFKQKEIENRAEVLEAKRRENVAKLINYKSGANNKVHKDFIKHAEFDAFDVRDKILNDRTAPTLSERLNSLPLTRITDECKEKVIKLVEQDIKNQNDDTWERMKDHYTVGPTTYDVGVDVPKEQENEDK